MEDGDTSYIQNPDKTEQGELVSSYQCSPLTVDEEFLLTKRLYEQTTGRSQKSDVIAYQVRQSFKPGKVTPEEANRIVYPPKESNRDRLRGIIDTILAEQPKDFEDFLQKLEQQGYEVKRGKHTAVKGKGQKRFIRFRTLGTGYGEDEIKAVLEGKAEHKPAKAAFDEAGLQKLPKVKELDAEFAELLTKKKAAYPDYRKARNEMQELVRAQKNVERFFAEEKPAQENEQAR